MSPLTGLLLPQVRFSTNIPPLNGARTRDLGRSMADCQRRRHGICSKNPLKAPAPSGAASSASVPLQKARYARSMIKIFSKLDFRSVWSSFCFAGSMTAPIPTRVKLSSAALSLVLVCAFGTLYHVAAFSSAGWVIRIAFLVFAVGLSFYGVYSSPWLQVCWGWGLAAVAPLLLAWSVFSLQGPWAAWGLLSTMAALLGSYLLLADKAVREYREKIRKGEAGTKNMLTTDGHG